MPQSSFIMFIKSLGNNMSLKLLFVSTILHFKSEKINYTKAPKMGEGGLHVFWKQFIIFFYLLK